MDALQTTPQHILAARAAGLSPLMCGALDAAAGRACDANDYVLDGDRAAYLEGFEAEADEMLAEAARNLGLMVLAMTGGAEYDRLVDTLEYESGIEDREFWARGC